MIQCLLWLIGIRERIALNDYKVTVAKNEDFKDMILN